MLNIFKLVALVTLLITGILAVDNLVAEGISFELILSKMIGSAIVIGAAGMRVP